MKDCFLRWTTPSQGLFVSATPWMSSQLLDSAWTSTQLTIQRTRSGLSQIEPSTLHSSINCGRLCCSSVQSEYFQSIFRWIHHQSHLKRTKWVHYPKSRPQMVIRPFKANENLFERAFCANTIHSPQQPFKTFPRKPDKNENSLTFILTAKSVEMSNRQIFIAIMIG